MFRVPNLLRLSKAECRRRGWPESIGSSFTSGNNGTFLIPSYTPSRPIKAIASDGAGWEHVGVSLMMRKPRVPNWEEMCAIKGLFWDDEDVVMQLHPRASEYVNYHPGCLHLWRPSGEIEIPTPPSILVGLKKEGVA